DARLDLQRQEALLARGVAPRAVFDRALKARQAADARVDAARAQLDTAREQLTYTELFADSAGAVTARGAEPGEVGAAGQRGVRGGQVGGRVARKGGRDAVFQVPPRVIEAAAGLDPEVTVTLTSDPGVRTTGRVREVSPQADPVTRTFEVKVGLTDPPEAMRL